MFLLLDDWIKALSRTAEADGAFTKAKKLGYNGV
jgi:hypothetical protein